MGAQPQEIRTAASEDLCGAARRREVQSSGSPLGEEGERHGIGIQWRHAVQEQDQAGQPGPHGARHVGASGGTVTNIHDAVVGEHDGRDDDQGRRVATQRCQSEPSERCESEAVDDSGTEGIEVNRKTKRQLQRSAKKWANAHEAHVVEPWDAVPSPSFIDT